MKIDKVIVSCDDSHYQYFWPAMSKICKMVLGITPVLFKVGDHDSDFFNDEYGIVKYVKKDSEIPTSTQGQLLRIYATRYFPDEICMISDIDMLLLKREYFIDNLEKYSDDSYLILSSDGYDLKRQDCVGIFDFQVYPMCYQVAKGKIFTEILEIDENYHTFQKKVLDFTSNIEHQWFCDEIYVSSLLNAKEKKYKIIKLERGFKEKFLLLDRIEKRSFPVDYRGNEELKNDNKIYGNYDVQKLKENYYIDCHCVRPYGWYKKEIWDIIQTVMEEKKIIEKDLILITAYCDTQEKIEVLRNLVNRFSDHKEKFDTMIFSHTAIPKEIAEKTDFTIFDKKNELIYDWDMRTTPWFDPNNERPIHSIFTGFYNKHLAIWRMIILGNSVAKNLGYKKVHHLEFDTDIQDFGEFYDNSKILDYKDAVVYNKLVQTVDPIIFGTYQCYRVDKLPSEFYELDENKIKNDIKYSLDKSPEKMLFDLLNHKENVEVKNKDLLDRNGNLFGMSHNKLSDDNHTAWCLPYYDKLTHMLGFIVWNMEGKKESISVQVIYNDEKVIDFGSIPKLNWRLLDIDEYNNAKKLVVILNNKIRNVFEFDKYKEEFKQASFRENYKRV